MIFFAAMYAGCAQKPSGGKTQSKLNFILLGYDSVACYYGNSSDIMDLKQGSLSDRNFAKALIKTAKQHEWDDSLPLVIKPTASPNVGDDYKKLVDLLNNNDLQKRSLDTLDKTERQVFNRISMQDVIDSSQATTFHLDLPKYETRQQDSATGSVADRLVVIIYGDSGIYAYSGADVHSGKKYTHAQLGTLLISRKSNPNFFVSIRPTGTSTYKSTVKILDEMIIAGIKNYALVDNSKEDEDYITDMQSK